MDKCKILIVNDSPVACAIIRAILEADGGYKIVGEAPTGRDAVRSMDALRPDIVLMDIHMPEMNGVEATKRIMANHKTSVLVTSATINRNLSYIFEAQAAGAIDFIHTPTLLRRPGSRVSDAELKRAGRTLLYKLRGIQKMRQRKQESIEAKLPSSERLRPNTSTCRTFLNDHPQRWVSRLSRLEHLQEDLQRLWSCYPSPAPALFPFWLCCTSINTFPGLTLWLEQTGFQANLVDRMTQMRPGEIYVAPGGEQNMIFTSAGAVRLEPRLRMKFMYPISTLS